MISIDKYFSIHYKFLVTVANNVLGNLNMSDEKHTLVSDCYLYMKSKEDEIMAENPTENRLKSIAINYMHKQVVWQKSDFKKNWVIKDNVELSNELESDITDDLVKEKEQDFEKKINHINKKVDNMTLDQKILFELFKSGINNSNKLSKHTGLSRTGCYNLLKKFKNNLRDGFE